MMAWFTRIGIALLLLAAAGAGHAQVVTKKALTLSAAKKIAAAAEAEAQKIRSATGASRRWPFPARRRYRGVSPSCLKGKSSAPSA